MTAPTLSPEQKLELYYWMRLTRTFDDRMLALWKQGRGVGGTFSQRGHEAIAVGAAYALEPDDVVAPMHRDLGCNLLRGLTPRRIFANLLGRETGVTRGRDANLHGMGDLNLGIIGFISHLPQSLGVALGIAMSFRYRHEPRVALTFTGDGASSAGLFHEVLNLSSVFDAPLVIIVENNQYAYSTPLSQQMKVFDIAERARGYGLPGVIVDGNDVEAVYAVVCEAVARARAGKGPTLIEAKTMRMLGHAIHDGAEYVPKELLEEWERKDPITSYEAVLQSEGVADAVELEEIGARCEREIEDAIAYAEASPWPSAESVSQGVYAP
ncbi:MAG: thiamine pyrophosphate-dependent dehydrogenase E1 component subunit alpha [Chloroflexi bacterium]|nr:thiamine pyrophosphate-dependent dehydrogenase E1 component subunit alpha [Chloroflexota bacterium]